MVYLCQWWTEETRREHYAPEGAEGNGCSQLKIFHNFKILVVSLREVVRLRRVVSLRAGSAPAADGVPMGGGVRFAQVTAA